MQRQSEPRADMQNRMKLPQIGAQCLDYQFARPMCEAMRRHSAAILCAEIRNRPLVLWTHMIVRCGEVAFWETV